MSWRRFARCAEPDAPGVWLSEGAEARRVAAAECARCPVRLDCLDDVLDTEGSVGPSGRATTRAGLTPADRYRLHRLTVAAARVQKAAQKAARAAA